MPEIAIVVGAFLAGGIGTLLAERAFHASGRHGLHLRPLRSTVGLRRARFQPSSEEFEELLRGYNVLASITRSPLSRVIGVGAAQIFDGITVECISLSGGHVVVGRQDSWRARRDRVSGGTAPTRSACRSVSSR